MRRTHNTAAAHLISAPAHQSRSSLAIWPNGELADIVQDTRRRRSCQSWHTNPLSSTRMLAASLRVCGCPGPNENTCHGNLRRNQQPQARRSQSCRTLLSLSLDDLPAGKKNHNFEPARRCLQVTHVLVPLCDTGRRPAQLPLPPLPLPSVVASGGGAMSSRQTDRQTDTTCPLRWGSKQRSGLLSWVFRDDRGEGDISLTSLMSSKKKEGRFPSD